MAAGRGIHWRDERGVLDPSVLRLVLITDGRADFGRVERIVRAAVEGGVRCVQLREPRWTARVLLQACERLRPVLDDVEGVLLVNDRIDVAATGVAHGVQIGHRSVPAELARDVLGEAGVLSYSAHELAELELAAAARCDCALLAPVWPTASKPTVPHLGEAHAAACTARARLPVVWLGGITPTEAARAADYEPPSRPAGVAVRSAICEAADPRYAAAALLRAVAASGAG